MRFYLVVLLFSSLVLAQRQVVGQAMGISGISEDTLKGTVRSVRLEQGNLRLETSAGVVTVTGYPTWLESQKLLGSSLTTTSRMRPDGIETRLELAQGKTPFLLLGSSTSPNSMLFGKWRFSLQTAERTAFINLEPQIMALPLGRGVVVRQGLLIWCVRLAALHLPIPSKPNVASEAESPRFDWAALRVTKAGQCQN